MREAPAVLFLDRDGVINEQVVGGYVTDWTEFEFSTGALDALATLGNHVPNIVILTNQQGVGKGLMSQSDLDRIHVALVQAATVAGARIDAILSCPHLATAQCACRKPEPGLALRWLFAHLGVDGSRSMMVGDSSTDIRMAKALARITGGCEAVSIGPNPTMPEADSCYESLRDFVADQPWLKE